jgi:hypothetical protein
MLQILYIFEIFKIFIKKAEENSFKRNITNAITQIITCILRIFSNLGQYQKIKLK